MESTPYEGEWPIGYFKTEDEAIEAFNFIYAFDEKYRSQGLPRTEWDWGYFVKEVTTKTLAEFKAPYQLIEDAHDEKITLGGDDCFVGRMRATGSDPNT